MRWPGRWAVRGRNPSGCIMLRDVLRIRESTGRRGTGTERDSGVRETARIEPEHAVKKFPSELFLRFRAREGPWGLAALPVILLRNSDNAAAMNNGGITRQKSANVFFRAVPEPRASQNFRVFASFAIWLSLLRYQTALNMKRMVSITGGYHIIITYLDCVVFSRFRKF